MLLLTLTLILTLTFNLSTPKPYHLIVGCPKLIPYTKFEHFGIFRFWVMFRTNKQTNKQTDGLHSSYPRRPFVSSKSYNCLVTEANAYVNN